METNKVLSGLNYLSILFAGFLFPLIVFFITEDKEVKSHAKKAFFSHLIPFIPIPFVILAAFLQIDSEVPILFLGGIVLTVILSFIILIWNIIKGIQILAK